MNDHHSHPQNEYSDADTPEDVRPLTALQGEEESELKAAEFHESENRSQQEHHPFLRLLYWCKAKAEKAGLHDWLMVIFTGVLTFVAIAQADLVYQNSKSSTEQINKMIDAANRIKDAATNFSESAKGIRGGVDSAVGKLNEQATQLKNSAVQAGRLAEETKRANENVTNSDRPWIGGRVDVRDFEFNKQPTFVVTFTNSGKRPARIYLSEFSANWYAAFPFNVEAQYRAADEAGASTTILVPGESSQLMETRKSALLQGDLDLAEGAHPANTFFIFAKAEYMDLQTGNSHATHICVYYIPRFKTQTDSGFRNCKEYNSAD